jgi:hypothetical protein
MNEKFLQTFARFSRLELLRRVGDMRQLAGAQPCELSDGNQRGSRVVRLYNAAGLDFDVFAERGLGIGRLAYRGVPFSWISSVGAAHPAYLESTPLAWLRNWPGGFLTPCGLTQVGSPDEENGALLGIHGRIANLPAYNLSWGADWQNERFTIWVEGTMHETAVFGENLTLKRRIWTRLDEARLWIEDRVENHGFDATPHMFLQHINLGFPLVGASARLELPPHTTTPRDEQALRGFDRCCQFDEPAHAYQEQVFYHELQPDNQGMVELSLVNPEFNHAAGMGVSLRYAKAEYPVFVEWKMMGEGLYVVGLEPANCHVEGRTKERQRGTLVMLEPGEVRNYCLEISFW